MGSRESVKRGCSTHKPMQKIFDSEKAVWKHSHKQYLTHLLVKKALLRNSVPKCTGFLRMFMKGFIKVSFVCCN